MTERMKLFQCLDLGRDIEFVMQKISEFEKSFEIQRSFPNNNFKEAHREDTI